MRILDIFSDNFSQEYTITTEDNQVFTFSVEYLEGQQSWFYSLAYNNFQLNNQRLVLDPNFLRRFKAYLPFGIACLAPADQVDPFLLNDLISGRIQLLLLTEAEVKVAEKTIYGQ